MSSNIFLKQLQKSSERDDSPAPARPETDNVFLNQLKSAPQSEAKEKPLPWTKGLGAQSLYRIPGLALQGIGGAIAGEPGNLASTFHGIGGVGAKASGEKPQKYEESSLSKILPTSEDLFKSSALKPQNKIEEFTQNLFKDATSLFLPGRYLRLGRYALNPMRSLAVSLGANTLGKGTEVYTGSKEKGDLVRHGFLLLGSFLNPQSAQRVVGETYQRANQLLPQNATVSGTRFQTRLNQISNRILQGRNYDQLAPSERWLIDRINDYQGLIQNGQLNMRGLVAQKRSTNERAGNELYTVAGRRERRRARELLGEVTHAVQDEFTQYGRTNPEWLRNQRLADQAFGTIQQSNLIQRAIRPLLQGKENSILSHIFGSGVAGAIGSISKPAALAAGAVYQGAKYIYRMTNSPLLRDHYMRVITSALTGNKESLKKAINGLEEALKKDEKKRTKD